MLLLGIAINKLRIAIVPWVVRGPQSIEHVSWYCPHYQHKRAVLQPLMSRTRGSKPCFQHATILTEADAELSDNIVVIQTTLVDIWHDFIRAYLMVRFPEQMIQRHTMEMLVSQIGMSVMVSIKMGIYC